MFANVGVNIKIVRHSIQREFNVTKRVRPVLLNRWFRKLIVARQNLKKVGHDNARAKHYNSVY